MTVQIQKMGLVILACLGVALVSWRALALLDTPLPESMPTKQPDMTDSAELPVEDEKLDGDDWRRPLFSVRSQQDDRGSKEIKEPSPFEMPKLVGLLVGREVRLALIALEGRLIRARVEDRVGSWIVRDIRARSIIVDDGRELSTLSLDKATQLNQ